MKSKETKRKECEARVEKWQQLTPQQQLDLLNEKLGKGIGAKKQRAKIYAVNPELETIVVHAVNVVAITANATIGRADKKKNIPNGSRVILR